MDVGCYKHESLPMEHGKRFHDCHNRHPTRYQRYPAADLDVNWTFSGADAGPFLREMQHRLSHKVWIQAAQPYCGKRAEDGVDVTVLRKHHKQRHTPGPVSFTNSPQHKFTVAQGVCEHNPAEIAQSACVHGGSPDDSTFHRVFDCRSLPVTAELDKTERILDEAKEKCR